ncbi:MAG: flagellar filament capping protein FliD [Gammaproteobacteria bacterium]
MITSPGIGSGLDINTLVSRLVAAEGDAKTALLASKRTNIQAEISAFGSLKSALTTFQGAVSKLQGSTTFAGNTLTSSEPLVFTASSAGSVAASNYNVEVVKLASAQKLLSPGYANSSSNVGTGTLNISVGTATFSVVIGSSNQTLIGIRDAINDSGDNPGVTATITNVDDGSGGTLSKLILTADNTGTKNTLTVTVNDTDLNNTDISGLSALYYDTSDATTPEQLTEINAAADAIIKIDGQTVTRSGNSITDAIQGVTLNLLKQDPGMTHTLTIGLDKDAVKASINDFIKNYNTLNGGINGLTLFDDQTGKRGRLIGDRTLLTLSGQLRRELAGTVSNPGGSVTNLVDLGITTKANGDLELDSSKLDSALAGDFDGVGKLFTSSNGIATRLNSLLNDYVKGNGILDSKTAGLNNTVKRIDVDLEALNRRLGNLQDSLLRQFNALDGLLNQLQGTSNFLQSQLASIATTSRK